MAAQCLEFDQTGGTKQWVAGGVGSTTRNLRTMACWVRITDYTDFQHTFGSVDGTVSALSVTGAGTGNFVALHPVDDGTVGGTTGGNQAVADDTSFTVIPDVTDNTWFYCAFVSNGTSVAHFYVYHDNGSGLAWTGPYDVTYSTGVPDTALFFGTDPDTIVYQSLMNGKVRLAFPRVWAANLTLSEIQAEAVSATPVRTSGLAWDNDFQAVASRGTNQHGGAGNWVTQGTPTLITTDGPPITVGGPTITGQPSDTQVAVGATATFSVTASASGGGTLSYQWKLNGSNISGATSASYTTGTLALTDNGGSYTCAVTETGGTSDGTNTSSAAILYVGIRRMAVGAAAFSSSGGTSVAPSYPAISGGILAGDLIVVELAQKPSSANGGTATTPSGYTLATSITGTTDGNTGGYTSTLGSQIGNVNLYTYTKTAAGGESGSLTITVGTNNVSGAVISVYRPPSGYTWSIAGTTGKDTSAGSVSIAGAADPGVAAGDYVICAHAGPTNYGTTATFSAEAVTETGVTFGTATELVEAGTTTGNRVGLVVWDALATAGPSSAAPTWTATAGGTTTNVRGPGTLLRFRASSGGTNTPMTISATQTQTASRIRALGLPRSAAQTQTALSLRGVTPGARSANVTQTPSRARAVGRTSSATQTQTTGSAPAVSGLGFNSAQTQTPSRARAIGAPKSVTQTQAASRLRSVAPIPKTVTQAQTPSVTKGQGFLKTLSATVSQSLTRLLALGRAHSGNQSSTPTAARAVAPAAKTATATGAPSYLRAVAPIPKTVTNAETPSLQKGQGFFRNASATATQTATRVLGVGQARSSTNAATPAVGSRSVGRTLTAAVSQTLSRARAVARTVAATQAQTGSSDQQQSGAGAHSMTLSATATQALTMLRAAARTLAGNITQAPSRARGVTPGARTATQAQAPSVTKGSGHFVSVSATSAQAGMVGRAVGVARQVAAAQAPAVARSLSRTLLGFASQVGKAARGFYHSLLSTVTQSPSETHGPAAPPGFLGRPISIRVVEIEPISIHVKEVDS